MHRTLFSYLLLVVLLAGCAGTDAARDASGRYRTEVGRATPFDVRDRAVEVLSRYHYQIARMEESSGGIYVESQWQERLPSDEEQAAGIAGVRTRVVVDAKPRIRRGAGNTLNSVDLMGEYMVRLQGEEAWRPGALEGAALERFKDLADDLKTAFDAGMRRY